MPQTNGSLTSGHSSSNSSSEASEIKSSSKKENIICTEVFDEHSSPTKDEVIEYARKIGIDVEKESELLYLAREGLLKELPAQWKPCLDDTIGDYYYFNTNSGETQWAHPLDEIYRQKVIVARESGKNASTSGVTEDSLAETMDKPKLGPLPPLGGGSSKGAGSLKGLPPLKKPPSIGALGSSLSSSPKSSPSRIERSSPNKENPSKLTTKDKTDSPMKTGLSLKLGGSNFLKPQAKELLTDDDEDDDNLNSEPPKIVSSESTKVRSILKGSSSPLTKKSANFSQDQVEPKKNLRAAMEKRDENRRIQFDIQAEKKALVMDEEPTETSSESAAIDDINVKKDFMEKHSLFDPAELFATTSNTSEVSNDDEDSEKNSAKPSPVKLNQEIKSQEKPKTEPKFVKSTSSDISEDISRNENLIQKSGISKAARPMSARHSSSPKKDFKSTSSDISEDISRNEKVTRRPPGTVPKTARPMSARNLSSVLQKEVPELKKSLTLSSSSSEEEKIDEFLQNVKFKEETVSTVQNKKREMEAEKFNFAKIEANLRAEHEAEMRGLKREMEKEKQENAKDKIENEEILKEMFEKDLENLKLHLEKEFACEKTQMLRDFEEKLTQEKNSLKIQFEKDFKIREDELKQEMEALKQEFQSKKESLENDLKSQFSQDIANLRKELEEAKKIQNSQAQKQNNFHPQNEPPEPQKSKKKVKNRSSSSKNHAFLREIEDLEEDIQELRSQVKIGSTLVYEDSDSDQNQDFYIRKPSPAAMQLQPQPYGLPQQPDLGRSLETLQQRVEVLERGLTPFTVPYPTFSTYSQPQPAQTMMNGFQYSPNTSPLANGIQVQVPNVEVPQQTRVMVNGWTVDEQIYKSKLWLKQRNQQMLHRSSK